ncbi:Lcl domain-containing protein, partial [Thalassobellus citreus]|uniref:Lcl domain-containing protein n=1 Tax=Thalassobellus citreus TaxID=3367752 RepID=UPI0037993943
GLAHAYTGGGFSDWFLPSKDELDEMYDKKTEINAGASLNSGSDLSVNPYWSSTESGTTSAWEQSFTIGNQSTNGKSATPTVRAVRAF